MLAPIGVVPGWLLTADPAELAALEASDVAVPPDCELAASLVAFDSDEEHPPREIASHVCNDAQAARSTERRTRCAWTIPNLVLRASRKQQTLATPESASSIQWPLE